jgi:hypothetical protein
MFTPYIEDGTYLKKGTKSSIDWLFIELDLRAISMHIK